MVDTHGFLRAEVADLVAQMTTGEKIDLLSGKNFWETQGVPRLGVPSIKVTDGPNGARGGSFFKMTRATALPNATCLASSFSTDLVHEAGGLLAVEAQARGAVCLLDPTVNIQRSPAGGRAFESFSEDPTVSGHVAAAYIQGLQAGGVSATIKHFVANDQEHERNGVNVVVAQRPLREVYLRPFQIAEKVAKPWAYMTSYSRLNGTHCSENPWLLKTLLRDEWGSDALVMSDWLGTYSATEAINAGLTLEMPGPTMWRSRRMIETLLSAHKIKPEALDARAAEVVAWVQKLAKINPELAFGPKGEEKTREDSRDKDGPLLRRLAGEGAVLLKNEGVLPLRTGKVAIIGPNAKAAVVTGGGSAQLRSAWTVSPWQGLEGTAPDGVELSYSLGCVSAKFLPILGEDFTTPDGKPGFALNHYAIVDGQVAAEPAVRDTHDVSKMLLADFRHPALGQHYVTEILATFTAPITGEYEFGVVVSGQGWLYVDDKLVIDNSTDQVMGESFFNNGTIEVRGTTKVEKGKKYNIRFVHDSRFPVDRMQNGPFVINGCRLGAFPVVDADAEIEAAVSAAAAAEVAVVVVGLNADWESEGYDRPTLSLPGRSDELVSRVAAANPNTVVVVQSGSAVTMPWANSVKSVVQAWYGGNEAGHGLADILYGRKNPSARMPLTFPVRKEDVAAFPNFKSARTQVYYDEGIWVGYKHHNVRKIAPQWAFGHGLSYTTFEYAGLEISAPSEKTTAAEWSATVKVTVTNTGDVAGDHAVLFFVSPPAETATSLKHPEVALQAFTKVYDLAPGASTVAEVKLDKYAISHWDEYSSSWRAEVGSWKVHVGADASSMLTSAPFEVKATMPWQGL